MDIWKWVEEVQDELVHQGHHRMAHLMRVLPSYTVNENHAQLDALVPEALALARAVKNPWIEIFVRHWNLQSRVAHRHEVSGMLPEAVSLVEFAHRDDSRDCPQSICVVQNLTNCYDQMDGPGYVEERLAVAKETLAKIDATWPCFSCISSEYAAALADAERYEEAYQFLEQQRQALLLAGKDGSSLSRSWVTALINLERYEEAYTFNQETHNLGGGESYLLSKTLKEAHLHALLGRYEEALKALPEFAKIAPTPSHYWSWAKGVHLLVEQNSYTNDWQLNAKFQQMSDTLSNNGVIRDAFTMMLWQAELALKRGYPNTASRCCDRAEALIPRLRKPLDAPEELEKIRSQIASAVAKSTDNLSVETPEQVLEALGENPESDIALLEHARQHWPENEVLALITARAYDAMGEHQYGREVLSQYLESYPNSPNTVLEYGFLFLAQGQHEALQNWASAMLKRDLDQEVHLNCHWLLALQYNKEEKFELAKPHLSSLLEQQPNAINSRMLLAELERKTGHLEAALQHLDKLVEMTEESGNYDWDRMVVATLLEEWDKVRHSAERVGFKNIPTEGPIDQEMGTCRIQFREADGESVTYYAVRTGPVTARIVEIAAPDNIQYYGDTVVFDPVKLNEPKEGDDEEAEPDNEYVIYPSIQTIKVGGYTSYFLDGVHPGKEQLLSLKEALKGLGCKCQVQSGEDYELYLGEDSEPMRGLYAYIAVPENQALQEVADLLATTTQNYAHPLIWPDMIEKLGDETELERQRGIGEEYGL
ncbi:MAG: hypothetical protein DRR08_03640 [Candidatus Parabeggiatoa sp. nov. 2]|nr:MAG: hypothetical protein B6247_01640 [Beggiatoa sp. 4572_84]RKZ63362.1 MAG: hypothetical protein DRR08_03640 [Gammaproteobacteria bacterium]HEC83881.1 hypothetical protein [Thioploca sp.]